LRFDFSWERAMAEHASVITTDDLLRRVCGEFLEMPGLRLRREQAQRLWGLDGPTCSEILDALVQSGFLRRLADGTYGRVTEDPVRQAS
jgi:hypothetical protein